MLIEIWERLRGYDRWILTTATVESSQMQKIPLHDRSGQVAGYTYDSADVLTWTDQFGEKQYADFNVPDNSPLYQLIGGESVSIRYNPQHPAQFYYQDLLKTRLHTVVTAACTVLFLLTLVIGWGWFVIQSHK